MRAMTLKSDGERYWLTGEYAGYLGSWCLIICIY